MPHFKNVAMEPGILVNLSKRLNVKTVHSPFPLLLRADFTFGRNSVFHRTRVQCSRYLLVVRSETITQFSLPLKLFSVTVYKLRFYRHQRENRGKRDTRYRYVLINSRLTLHICDLSFAGAFYVGHFPFGIGFWGEEIDKLYFILQDIGYTVL